MKGRKGKITIKEVEEEMEFVESDEEDTEKGGGKEEDIRIRVMRANVVRNCSAA